jgi:HEAT repeat protein
MGHSLNYWVRMLGDWDGMSGAQERDAAEAAVRMAGTNAVPSLIEWFKDEGKAPISRATSSLLQNMNKSWYSSYSPLIRSIGAEQALRILGPQAKSAIPELTRLMNAPTNSSIAQRAAMILPNLGPGAVQPIAAILTNNSPIRLLVINCIPALGSNARPLVPELVHLLRDKDEQVATFAAIALGKFRFDAAIAIPALTNSLQDPRPWMRLSAARALLNFTNPPDAARTTLLALLSDSNEGVSAAASNALRRADINVPDEH